MALRSSISVARGHRVRTSDRHSHPGLRRRSSILALLMFLLAGLLPAQPTLNFKRAIVVWPEVDLYFTVACAGAPVFNLDKTNTRVIDNGVEMHDYTLHCPDPADRCASSVTLLFDASGSMAGAGNAGAKAGGHTFVDLMDGVIDEAALMWFNTAGINVAQSMTTIKPALDAAIDMIPASGGTPLWDGLYGGIIELINNGVNPCRAVVLLSDGADNASTRTVAECIALANRNRIRVFTIGLGSGIDPTLLEMTALLTGGRFYQTADPQTLPSIYTEIAGLIFQGFQECRITLQGVCADGARHTVELQIHDICNGTDAKSKVFVTPLDSTTFQTVNMKLGDAAVLGAADVTVPLRVLGPLPSNNVFQPFSCTVRYDTTHLAFGSVATPPGTLLENVPLQVTPSSGAITIRVQNSVVLPGSGTLLHCVFRQVHPGDSACSVVRAEDARFEAGCTVPDVRPGQACVNATVPVLTGRIEGPDTLRWNADSLSYVPRFFDLRFRVRNDGTATARNMLCRITYDTTVLARLSPGADTLTGTPADVAAGGESEVHWRFTAKNLTGPVQTTFCIEAAFDNHPDLMDCASIVIPTAGAVPVCSLTVPLVSADNRNLRYVPMPVPVTVHVRNIGGMDLRATSVRLDVPPGLTLNPGSTIVQMLSPSTVPPGGGGQATWELVAGTDTLERRFQLRVCIISSDAAPVCCDAELVLPPLMGHFHFTIDPGGRQELCSGDSLILHAVSGQASYLWSTGQTEPQITVRTGGSYWCTTQAFNGAMGISETVMVIVHPLPHPRIAVAGSIPFCPGDTIVLDAGGGLVTDVRWNTGAQGRTLAVTEAGTYWALVTNNYGCKGTTDSVVVTLKIAPPRPFITRNGDVLLTDNAIAYQWMRNGADMPGETRQFLTLRETGRYQVRITGTNGCTSLSDPFDVTVLGMNDAPAPGNCAIRIHPTPTRSEVTIEITGRIDNSGEVYFVDVLGRARMLAGLPRGPVSFRQTVPLDGMPSGVYHVVLLTPGGAQARRFVKM